jgi:hypothetical protein
MFDGSSKLMATKRFSLPWACIENISRTRFGCSVEEDKGYEAVVVGSPKNHCD